MTDYRPRSGVRLTDAEREQAASLLFAAHHDGRISLDELDQRLARVYAATVAGQLEPLLADVPTDRDRRALAGDVVEFDARTFGLTRTGRWTVPRRFRVRQHPEARGLVLLDFSTARIAHRVVEVDLRLGMWGSARLVLPSGGTADVERLQGRGRLARTEVPAAAGAAGVHLIVTGRLPYRRDVRIRYPRSRRRWWF
ncbi:MAG: DUF1707 domain-containing protein [Pseudonocardia sp.]|nr:DUF1707 domain-containing protein [Pseudonocardia sp.]